MSMSNAELVEACLHGDARAWEQLVDRYARLVYSIPARYRLPDAEADDIFQEVYLALAQHLHAIEDPARLPAWLITTTRRLVWRALVNRRKEQPLEAAELAESDLLTKGVHGITPPLTLAELMSGWQRQELLAQGLQRLSERCGRLLTLLYLEQSEPTYDEISRELGLPKGSIGPTRVRCIQQLRMILEGLGFDAENE